MYVALVRHVLKLYYMPSAGIEHGIGSHLVTVKYFYVNSQYPIETVWHQFNLQ